MVCAVELILDNRLSHVLPFSFRLLSPLRNETVLLYSCYAIFFSLLTASRPPTLSSKDVLFPEDTALF